MHARKYPGLDLVRFAAALSVTLYHLVYWWWLPSASASPIPPIAVEPFRWGSVGVPVFFVLSGFVIAFSAEGKTVGQFAISRVLRLYPAAWICALLTLVLTRIGTPHAWSDFLRSIILSPIGPWISGVYWTLAIEIAFYLLVALFVWRGWKLMTLAMWLGCLSGAYWLFRLADFASGGHFKGLFALTDSPVGNLTLLPQGCLFAIGIAFHNWAARAQAKRALALAAFCIVPGAISVAANARFEIFLYGGSTIQILEPTLFWLAATAAIAACIRWNDRILTRWGKYTDAARKIGLATYPLYLVHSEVGHALMLRLLEIGPALALAVTVSIMIAASFAVVELEQYPRMVFKRVMSLKRPASKAVAADLP